MYIKRVSFFRTTQQRRLMLWFAGLGFSLDDDEDINPIGTERKSFPTYVNDMFNILWYINTYICMLNAFVHGCVMNNILMIIITLHSIEKSSNITHPYTNALSTHIYMYVKYKIWQYKSFYTYIIGIFNVMLYIKYIYMYVICSCTCVCDEQYFNDYNNTTQH